MSKEVLKRGEFSRARSIGIIIVLGTLITIGPFSIDAYLPAFKSIAGDFGVDTSAIGLTLTTYFIGIGFGQLAYGPLMDRFGRRKPLIIGLTLYITTSALSAFAWDVLSLAVLRFFSALGACAGMVASKAIVRDLYDKEKVADVLSTLLLLMGIAPIIAPSVGTVIIQYLSWQYVFYGLAAFALLMLVNVVFFLPESSVPNRQKSLRPFPVFKEYWSIYKNHDFFLFSTARGFVVGILLGYVAAAPFIFQDFFNLSEREFAYFFGANAASLILGSQINRLFLLRYSTFQITYVVSFLLMIIVSSGLLYVTIAEPAFWVTYPVLFFMMMMVGFQNPNVTSLALQPFTKKAGSASAFVGAVSMIFGSIASWFVSQFLNNSLIPLFVMLTFCGISAHLAIEVYRSRYARGYAFAKANFKQLNALKKGK